MSAGDPNWNDGYAQGFAKGWNDAIETAAKVVADSDVVTFV